MSYLALNPSTINDNDEIIGNYSNTNMNGNKPRQLRNSNNKTIKKRFNPNMQNVNAMSPKVQNMLQTINNTNVNGITNANMANANINEFEGMENENEPAEFNPPIYGELTKTPNVTENNSNGYPVNITKESFKGLGYSTISNNSNNDIGTNDEYIKPFINYTNNQTEDDTMLKKKKDTMLEKLNYMIMLLEEQQNERTDHIMEELILYFFLGIFMIFMVDSFVRSGKYVR